MGKLLEYFFGRKEQVIIPEKSTLEESWISSNFTLRWIHRLEAWKITADEYQKAKGKRSDEDTILELYKKLLIKHRSKPIVLQSLYYELAMIQSELGRESKTSLQLAHKNILVHYKKSKNVKKVVIENAGRTACPSCKKLDGWVLALTQAAKKKILPNKKCTKKHGKAHFCRCTYEPMMEIR